MDIGLAMRVMRLRTWTAMAVSPCWPSDDLARNVEPMMCL